MKKAHNHTDNLNPEQWKVKLDERHQRYLQKKIKTEGRKLLCRSLHARQEILSINNENNPSCFRQDFIKLGFEPWMTRNINNMHRFYFAFLQKRATGG